jgi:osmoprotectant transport system permease protein
MTEVVAWLTDPANWEGPTGIPTRLFEHVFISAISIFFATLIALPVGLWVGHTGRWANVAINVANIGRAIPSYSLLVIVLPISLALAPTIGYSPNFGLTFLPTFIAMVMLAIPPILVNAYAGLQSVDRDLLEAGRGMGMREGQILRRLEIPLAVPVIIGGFRTAILNVIATATIGAAVSFGGLGRYIFDGRQRGVAGTPELLSGAILVGALAILVDFVLSRIQRRATPRALRGTPPPGAGPERMATQGAEP